MSPSTILAPIPTAQLEVGVRKAVAAEVYIVLVFIQFQDFFHKDAASIEGDRSRLKMRT